MLVTGGIVTMKRMVIKALQVVAVIACLVFFFMPPRTFTQVVLGFVSLVVVFIFGIVAGHLDDKNTGIGPRSQSDKPEV